MAGRFSRTYSRKRPQPAPPISQFDVLVKEGSSAASNQPAATKTAGHIGKWGMTSFTSLRAINGGIGKDKDEYGESPNTSPTHTLGESSVLYHPSYVDGCNSLVEKPVQTYKRRKFFKSRDAVEDSASAAPDSHPSGVVLGDDSSSFMHDTSGTKDYAVPNIMSTERVSSALSKDHAVPNVLSKTNRINNNSNKRDISSDFDSLLASTPLDSIVLKKSCKSETLTLLPTTLPLEHHHSPISYDTEEASYSSVPSVKEGSGSTGIKIKIFKSRTSESWSQEQYSSRVELSSDDSKSSSASSSVASSPSSADTNDIEKDVTTTVRTLSRTKTIDMKTVHNKDTASVLETLNFSTYSTDSSHPFLHGAPQDSSLHDTLPLNTTFESVNINTSLDSSSEFGEITDQRTGLPVSMYNKFKTSTTTSAANDLPPTPSRHVPLLLSATDTESISSPRVKSIRHTYTKNVSKSRELNNYLSKNSETMSIKFNESKIPESLPSASIDIDYSTKNTFSCSSNSSGDSYAKNNKTVARKFENESIMDVSDNINNNTACKDKLSLDVRNGALNIPPSTVYAKPGPSRLHWPSSALDVNNSSISSNLIESKVPDLFSSGFDEEEIIDRTQVDDESVCADPGAERNGLADIEENAGTAMQNPRVLDLPSATDTTTADQSITSRQISIDSLKKSASLPARSILRSTYNSLSKETSADIPKSNSMATTRKRSIFKSRVVQDDGTKKRATYNHKWHCTNEDKDDPFALPSSKSSAGSLPKAGNSGSSQEQSPFDDYDFDGSSASSLKRVQSWSAQPSSSSVLPDLDDPTDSGSQVTKVKCTKAAKQYYTVIKNVKKLHQLQESGEFQEFNDDVEYFLDALRSSNSTSTRCLAALNLVHKCMVPAFRMHLRAHATVCKFFRALQDAPKHPSLSLCSAMVMFTLSQDRLNMDLDRDSLELMLNLLDCDGASSTVSSGDGVSSSGSSSAANGTNAITEAMTKIKDLCSQLQKKGHAKHLDLDSIDTGTLAMETLLSLTSKRAGEWFKEELRELGGVDHLVRTVTMCVKSQLALTASPEAGLRWDRNNAETFSKVERCLKVLENVTHQNVSNQDYLLQYQSGVFAITLMNWFRLCHELVPRAFASSQATSNSTPERLTTLSSPTKIKITLPKSPDGVVTICGSGVHKKKHLVSTEAPKKKEQTVTALQCVSSALITSMKVLVNLTHNSMKLGLGSKMLGAQGHTYNITLRCLLVLPQYLSSETKFEVMVLSCCLLLNLVELSIDNRATLMKTDEPRDLAVKNQEEDDDTDFYSSRRLRKSKAAASSRGHGAMRALVRLFYTCEASAKEHEAHTDQIIDRDLDQTARNKNKEEKNKEDDLEETVAKLLQKAGRHMEDTLVAAYTALLTGYCIMDNKECEEAVRGMQPETNFRSMVAVLKKFLHFMDLTATTSLLRALKPAQRVVKYMEKLDPPLQRCTSVAEREKRERDRRERGEESGDSADDMMEENGPSDSLMDSFGF